MSETCPGTGGFVFFREGPQFGAQWDEEPCDVCGGFHDRDHAAATDDTPGGDK